MIVAIRYDFSTRGFRVYGPFSSTEDEQLREALVRDGFVDPEEEIKLNENYFGGEDARVNIILVETLLPETMASGLL